MTQLIDVILENNSAPTGLYGRWAQIINSQYESPIIDTTYTADDFIKLYQAINASAPAAQAEFVIGPHVNKLIKTHDDISNSNRSKASQRSRLIWITNPSAELYDALFTDKHANSDLVIHSIMDHRLNGSYRIDDPYGAAEVIPNTQYYAAQRQNWPAQTMIKAVQLDPKAVGLLINKFDMIPLDALQIAARVDKNVYKEYQHLFDYYKKLNHAAQLAMVKKDGMTLRKLYELGINPGEDIKKAAVIQNCRAIQFIPNPSSSIQFTAIKAAAALGIHREVLELIHGNKSPNIFDYIEMIEHN